MNKFFKVTDKKIEKINGKKIPSSWWSRKYEFAFANDYVNRFDVCLYASFNHAKPFQEYLLDNTKRCYDYEKIFPMIENEDYERVDKIFCIGNLEHDDNMINILKNCITVLKDDGIIIITMDYPLYNPFDLPKIIDEIGLMFVGDVNYYPDEKNVLERKLHGSETLKCFSAVLKKKVDKPKNEYKPKKKIEYETKIDIPLETKKVTSKKSVTTSKKKTTKKTSKSKSKKT